MIRKGRRIGEKDGAIQAITASLSRQRGLVSIGLVLFVVLGNIACLGIGAVTAMSNAKVTAVVTAQNADAVFALTDYYPANVAIETSVSPLKVSPGELIEISIVVDNVGKEAIMNNNGRLRIGIRGPNEIEGHGIKEVLFDLNVSEKKTFKVGWRVPETAPSAEYRADAGASLYIGSIPFEITEHEMSKPSAHFNVFNVTEPEPTLMPTPTRTPLSTPTPTPEAPGFEALFAIAGLLAVAYLVLKRRE